MGHLTVFLSIVSILLQVFFGYVASAADSQANFPSSNTLPVYGYEIVATYNHDTTFFTQGLVFDNGMLYEGTGKYGQSRLICMHTDGSIKKIRKLPSHLFGEGVTVFGDDIVQLTWKAGIGIVRDKKSFQVKRIFHYFGEGWGITHDNQWLIMSDGSSSLYFLDPLSFSYHHKLEVSASGTPVKFLNELEYIKGEIWANIWKDSRIVKINPMNGNVTGWVDLSELNRKEASAGGDNVLNGIAYDNENDRIFVTGKYWSKIFEIKILKKEKGRHTSVFENK